jgi:hypothetical protein
MPFGRGPLGFGAFAFRVSDASLLGKTLVVMVSLVASWLLAPWGSGFKLAGKFPTLGGATGSLACCVCLGASIVDRRVGRRRKLKLDDVENRALCPKELVEEKRKGNRDARSNRGCDMMTLVEEL